MVALKIGKKELLKRTLVALTVVIAVVIAACTQAESTPQPSDAATPSPTPTPFQADSLSAPQRTPGRAFQLLPRDAIRPIYNPTFIPASGSDLDPNEMVIGVEFNGDTRAYPIRYLRTREIVNDTVGGIPILVTW